MAIKLRNGIFLAPFHPLDEDPTLCIHRDLELVENRRQRFFLFFVWGLEFRFDCHALKYRTPWCPSIRESLEPETDDFYTCVWY